MASITGAALALMSLPWVRTLALAHVIEDPALELVTGGALAVDGSEIALS
ncbi:MAG: hypothetical protein WKF60_03735 [Ilumatobacter sp.]